MTHTQADLEAALRQIKHAEDRITEQQARIARLMRHGQPIEFAEDLLRALRQSRELLQKHLATMTGTAKGGNLGFDS